MKLQLDLLLALAQKRGAALSVEAARLRWVKALTDPLSSARLCRVPKFGNYVKGRPLGFFSVFPVRRLKIFAAPLPVLSGRLAAAFWGWATTAG